MFFRIALLLATLGAVSALGAATPPRPNILLIISDDLRDAVGAYGNHQVHTPNIDAFTATAVTFEHAYAQYPVCNPSRSSFLTGLRPNETGVFDNRAILRETKPDVITWPQYLRQHGWYTACFGKVFHTVGRTDAERARYQDRANSWDDTFYDTAERVPGPVVAGRNLTDGKLGWCRWAAVDCRDEDMPDGQSAARAIDAMQRAGDKPWFIAVGFHRPHDPFIAPRKYFDLYPESSLTLKRDPADEAPAPRLAIPLGAFKDAFAKFTDHERFEFLRAYYAGVSFMDAQLGKVLGALDALPARDHTLVIFMGDNGYHLGERNWWNKDTLFDRSCRVPLVIRAPGAAAGGSCPAVVELVDLFPTALDFAGLPPPPGLVGRSLRPRIQAPRSAGKGTATTVVVRGKQSGQSVRTADWRFTEWTDGTAELYDEQHDPEETHNLFDVPGHQAVVARLKPLLPPAPHRP